MIMMKIKKKKETTYILIPTNNKNILIQDKPKIYCDFTLQEDNEAEKDKSSTNNSTPYIKKNKKYIISLYIKDEDNLDKKYNMNDIIKFIDDCTEKYELSKSDKILNDTNKYNYEYLYCEKSENVIELYFNEGILDNTKDLDKNIFFDGKDLLLKYLDQYEKKNKYI